MAGCAEARRPIWIVCMILDSGEVNRLRQRLDLQGASAAGPVEAGDEIVSFDIGLVRHRFVCDRLSARRP